MTNSYILLLVMHQLGELVDTMVVEMDTMIQKVKQLVVVEAPRT